MPSQPNAKAIFNVACSIESVEAREDYLRHICGDDQALLERVAALLRMQDEAPSFLESPLVDADLTLDFGPVAERPGTQIGPYKLLEEIGEGGMGVVYMAHQREPVRRKVALKIIKPGTDTREVIARFTAEKQTLAMMDHPNIAKVHDAGATQSGRPYFVMELVNGVPITEFCDDNRSTTRQRLELFGLVCNAIQHAHQKGIIHRDIKPSNILVTLHDGVPVPKVIDFGIAKAINQDLTANTAAFTGFGEMIGTPMYMSPEQAERSGLDIDTRTDVYSLGVLLYELLTGTTPFDQDQLQEAGLDEMCRLIREQEPQRPSTRVSTMGKAATTMSEHRQTVPAELSHTLRQEVDWIVMKALDKDRTRRYETATDFARDIQRYLNDEPVEACPPSTIYRLRKFTRRHKTAVLTTIVVSLALIVGFGVATTQALRATNAKKKEEITRKRSEAVTDFLVEIFRSPDPERDGRKITVAEMLDKAQTKVEEEFNDDPLLQAELLQAIGETYSGLGLVRETSEVMTKSCGLFVENLGVTHPDTLAAKNALADAYLSAGLRDKLLPLVKETLKLRQEVLGAKHPHSLETMRLLARAHIDLGQPKEAVRISERVLRLCKTAMGSEHRDTLDSMNVLASAYSAAGKNMEALQVHDETLKLRKIVLGPEHPDTLISMGNLAVAHLNTDDWQEARRLHEEVIPIFREKLGPDHVETLALMSNLASVYAELALRNEAIELSKQVWDIRRDKLGPDHPSTLSSLNNVGASYLKAGQVKDAIPLFKEAVNLAEKNLGPEHPDTLPPLNNLAVAYGIAGNWSEALALAEQVCEAHKKVLGPDHPDTVGSMGFLAGAYQNNDRWSEAAALHEKVVKACKENLSNKKTLVAMSNLAACYWRMGAYDRSVPLFEEVFSGMKTEYGEVHPMTLGVMASLGTNYKDAGQTAKAVSLLEETLKLCEAELPPDDITMLTMNNLAIAYSSSHRNEDALPLLEKAVEIYREKFGNDHPDTLLAMNNLASTYSKSGRQELALELHEETLKLRRKKLGPNHFQTLESLQNLGRIHISQRNYADAERLLLEAYRGFAERQTAEPTPYDKQKVREVLHDLVQLYEKSEQPEEAASWQEKLDAMKTDAENDDTND